MTEAQIPLMALLAFLGGCVAGVWIKKSGRTSAVLLVATIVLDMAGWMIYGFTVNWRPSWGIQHIVLNVLSLLPGMVLFVGVPAVAGFGLSVLVFRIIFRKATRSR